MKRYLESTEYINWNTPEILVQAKHLAQGASDSEQIIRRTFEFFRDEIKHSWDYKLNPVTCKVSDVLQHRTGYCYAKSHLLAALLRANKIPGGLCYQRLTITDAPPFCLHGLNAVYIAELGWFRIDARANEEGVTAEFCLPVEKLPFTATLEGEADLPEIWAEPLPDVVKVLARSQSYQEVADSLPDVELVMVDVYTKDSTTHPATPQPAVESA